MSDMTHSPANPLLRRLPIILIGAVAILGAVFLRDYLTFQTLADQRDTLLAFRDANYLLTVALFILAYVVIVAFSLPGAALGGKSWPFVPLSGAPGGIWLASS